MQRDLFFRLQRIFRLILATIIGTLNLGGIAASCWLAQSAPFDAFLTRSLAFLTAPHHIGWMRFIPADYIPFAHQFLAFMHHSDTIAAITLSSMTTAISTLALFALLQLNLPKQLTAQANCWQAQQAARQLRELSATMQQIDLYTLPPEHYSELMREFDNLYRQTQAERPRFTLSPLWSQLPLSMA